MGHFFTWAAGSTVATAAAGAAGGPDYAGIALLVSALAGLISAVTAMVIALRRKQPADETTVALLQQIADNLKDGP